MNSKQPWIILFLIFLFILSGWGEFKSSSLSLPAQAAELYTYNKNIQHRQIEEFTSENVQHAYPPPVNVYEPDNYKAYISLSVNGCNDRICPLKSPTIPRPHCTDRDNDGYSRSGGDCGTIDCNDGNPSINPWATEICDNKRDDNCNGKIDQTDTACGGAPNIIFIGWDGTQRDQFWQCFNKELPECSEGLPNIASLNLYDLTVTNGSSHTKPGWSQLFTGYNAEITGVYTNDDYQPIPEGYTIFEKVEHYFGPRNVITMFISEKGENTGGDCLGESTIKNQTLVIEDRGQPFCLTKSRLDYFENSRSLNVGNRALELLETHKDDQILALFLFRIPDEIGHGLGVNSVDYAKGLIEDDYWTGRIINKLKVLGIFDNTLIYILSDHGFDEVGPRHVSAPYTIFASNDPLIVREGDRRDLAPTILERYGISLGQYGSAPPIDGYSMYHILPYSTVPEGTSFLDYPGAPVCSDGLQLIGLDVKWSRECYPPTGGTGDSSGYCTNCGNNICEPPENKCNCSADCF